MLAYVSPYIVFTEAFSVPVNALLSPDEGQLYFGGYRDETFTCLH